MHLFLFAQVILDQTELADDGLKLAQLLLQAIGSGNWGLVAALAVMLLVWGVRHFAIPHFAQRFPLLADKRFTIALGLVGSVVGAILTALLAGAPITLMLVIKAVMVGLAAVGLWSAGKNTAEAMKPKVYAPVDARLSAVVDRPLGEKLK